MRILIDTSTFIFIVHEPKRLSRRALRALEHPDVTIEMSTLSLSEIALKGTNRLELAPSQIRFEIERSGISLLPFQEHHVWAFLDLPKYHHDPFDRQLIAQAIAEEIPVVTPDASFDLYPVKVIW